jgi:hypothetical protein
MSDLYQILKEEYEKSIQTLIDPQSLLTLIEEVMHQTPPLAEERQQGFDYGAEYSAKTVEFTYSAIPIPPISELAWGALDSNDHGARGKRHQLEQFLTKIGGNDMREKLVQLNKFLNDPVHASQLASRGDTDSERIASTLSYLIFFKTLTEIITNFNAASAGFNFESFMAVLLGGGQIATGNKTIADLTDERGIPISLKLYAEKSVKAGGSWTDLVNDLIRADLRYTKSGSGKGSFMQYMVATKTLDGEGFDRSGEINFYRYVLTLDNIMQIMANSADEKNHAWIRLPQAIIDDPEVLIQMEKPNQPSQQDVEQLFVKVVQDELAGASFDIEQLLGAIDYSKRPELFTGGLVGLSHFARGARGKALGWDGGVRAASPIVVTLRTAAEDGLFPEEDVQRVHAAVHKANEIARAEAIQALELFKKYKQGLEGGTASTSDSVMFYNRLAANGQTKLMQRALLFTLGYQRREQYELRKADIKNIEQLAAPFPVFGSRVTGTRGQETVWIGKLEVGRTGIIDMLNALINDVNRDMFKLFENLKVLTDSLQSYFAGSEKVAPMEDDDLAQTAIEAADDIGSTTEEFRS